MKNPGWSVETALTARVNTLRADVDAKERRLQEASTEARIASAKLSEAQDALSTYREYTKEVSRENS